MGDHVNEARGKSNMTATTKAWLVHLYTASGAVLALLAIDAVYHGAYGAAFGWMTLATWIDSTDGALARHFRVKEVVPQFDGARLDDIVDYLNYVLVPVLLTFVAGLIPNGTVGVCVAMLPLLASGYGFAQVNAKTPDHFFTGFPSYWNIVVLYLYVLGLPVWLNVTTIAFLSAMVFVPIRYLYPSRSPVARGLTYVLGGIWGLLVVALLTQFPSPSRTLAIVSLFFPAYYVGLSLYLHLTRPPTPVVAGP
jgi:phosphatidylcholine synthase